MAISDDLAKTLGNFYKTCKYEKFMFKYQSYMDNKKINSEIKNYLRILNTNFLFLVDEKKAFREYERINLPTENKYIQAFHFLNVIYLTKKKMFTDAKDKLQIMKKYRSLSKEDIKSLEIFIDVYCDKDIPDIEKMFSLNNPILYQNVFNARILMDYFALKGDKKCSDYASFLVKQKTDFTDTVNRAKEIVAIFKQK